MHALELEPVGRAFEHRLCGTLPGVCRTGEKTEGIELSTRLDLVREIGMLSTIECTRGLATKLPARWRRSTMPLAARRESALLTVMREQP